jgi:N-acetylglucosaminyldiphosphoundecaprenol N-acetyl-beta-D-mannosaminyltransferase
MISNGSGAPLHRSAETSLADDGKVICASKASSLFGSLRRATVLRFVQMDLEHGALSATEPHRVASPPSDGESSGLARCPVLGVECFAGDPATAARAVAERALAGSGGYCCFCNVHVLGLVQRHENVRRALEDAWIVFPDGAPVAWLQRRFGVVSQRVPGPDLMPSVLGLGLPAGLRHFLFGSTPQVLDALQERLRAAYPGIRIAGALSPPFELTSEHRWGWAMDEISRTEPHVVWCALGAPQQELWMHRHANGLSPALVLGVGAAFDFLAGTKHRAPLWMQRCSLEWLHRLASEPCRLSGRYVRTNSAFVLRAGIELLKRRRIAERPV